MQHYRELTLSMGIIWSMCTNNVQIMAFAIYNTRLMISYIRIVTSPKHEWQRC